MPPPTGKLALEGVSVAEHDMSDWTRVAVWPPAVIVAVREDPVTLVFAETDTATIPIPELEAPPTTVAQLESLEAVHKHPDGARTL
jgi:hypothetical protein